MRSLFLAPRVPYPPNRGDRIRSWHWLQYFARRGRVDLACTTDAAPTDDQIATLGRLCERVEIVAAPAPQWWAAARSLLQGRSATEGVFNSTQLHRTLRDWQRTTTYDVVFGYCSSMTPYVKTLQSKRSRTFIDLVDVDSCKWQDYASKSRGVRGALYRWERNRVVELERQAAHLSHCLFVTTRPEAQAAGKVCPEATICVLHNGVDLEYFGEVPPVGDACRQSPTCVFTGVLDYRPNVEAVEWFIENVWKNVRSYAPTARFLVVGQNPTRTVRRLAAEPGIELRADVADVRPSLAESTVVIAPLQIARGVQNKILEGMAAERAVIASPQAAAGLEAVAGTDLLVADHPQDWCAAITRLFKDQDECRRIAAAGLHYVRQNHNWDEQFRLLDGRLGLIAESHSAPATAQ